jgi:hypothetical protein
MALSNPSAADLSRYSVGEITQLVGAPVFYNAGSSKWLQTGSYTAASNLGAAAKTNLAAGSTAANINISMLSNAESLLYSNNPQSPLPPQRISSSGVTVYPCASGTQLTSVLTVTSAGAQVIPTGLTAVNASSSAGTNIVIASNNTTIFAYVISTSSSFAAKSTTDGINWSSVTLTGLPTVSSLGSVRSWGSGSLTLNYPNGRQRADAGRYMVFWCGARFIMVIPDGSGYYITSTSTNGIAWSGDTTLTVINNNAVATTNSFDFYRNGNNCYLQVGSVSRYTTDGGITWADCSSMSFYGNGYNQKTNATTPAKLFYTNQSTTALFSADSGATWTSRTLPLSTNSDSTLAYRGSTVLIGRSNGVQRSVDDGATWTPVIFPAGTLSNYGFVFGDANRFYFIPYTQPQILTSTDGITWTIVSVATGGFVVSGGWGGIISFSSNNVVLVGYNNSSGYDICYLTTDGGVTWKVTTITNQQNTTNELFIGDAFITPDGLGGGTSVFGGYGGGYYGQTQSNVCSASTVASGGGFYRTGNTAVTATNSGASVYARVE